MEYVLIALQLIVALSLLNVWLIQSGKPTKWRGGNAQNIVEEFKVYGLPVWMCYFVGILKVAGALMLIAAIWIPEVLKPAAIGLAVLLFGSIIMHIKIKDPLYKSIPAFIFLVICLFLAFNEYVL